MEILLTAAVALFLCWLLDKAFIKLFRSKPQHRSGQSVRLSKRNAIAGVLLTVLGVSCLLAGLNVSLLLIVCGCIMLAAGIALLVYYLSFGIYYDDDTMICASFGRKSRTYRFGDIQHQQLYINGGQVIIELYMHDGGSVLLQSSMTEVYTFLDHAFFAWCRHTGRDPLSCTFHDPANSCWFPKQEEL